MISIRKTFAMTALALALAACGGGNSNGGSSDTSAPSTNSDPATAVTPATETVVTPDPVQAGPAALMFLADGITLHAATVTATGYTETGSASIPSADLVPGHQIFSVLVHPEQEVGLRRFWYHRHQPYELEQCAAEPLRDRLEHRGADLRRFDAHDQHRPRMCQQ